MIRQALRLRSRIGVIWLIVLSMACPFVAAAADPPPPVVKRGYADMRWGQVNYRMATPRIPRAQWKRTLVLFHQSPLSSLEYGPLIAEIDGPLRRVDVERPIPGPGQVVVRVHASAVNPLDVKIRSGRAAHARQPLPAILGLELAGTVTETGPGVAALSRGDEVYGLAGGVGGLHLSIPPPITGGGGE